MSTPGPANVSNDDILGEMFLYVLTLSTIGQIFLHFDDDNVDGDKSVKCSAKIRAEFVWLVLE